MKKAMITLLVAATACQLVDSSPQSAADGWPGSGFEGAAFEFDRVTDDVYLARGTGSLTVGSNAGVVINEDDVLLVDSHVSPVAAAALIDELSTVTDKPVRFVVNSHFHFDHAHGNQAYPTDVEVIGHEFTREMLANGESMARTYEGFREAWADRPGFLASQEGLDPIPPNTTLSERMTLFRGGREIRLLFFGRGHTGGDIVVHLPAERILLTGDLLLAGLPYMGDGFPNDWVATLEELKGLEFDTVLPGHGPAFTDKAIIDNLQSYLTDLWARAGIAYEQGLSVEEASAQLDLTDHADAYSTIRGPGAPLTAVRRVYELLEAVER